MKQVNWDLLYRTDLAVEQLRTDEPFAGVSITRREYDAGLVSKVVIEDQQGAEAMGRAPGNYITIEARGLWEGGPERHRQLSELLASELRPLLEEHSVDPAGTTLVVGLGNWNVTPDALGPRVIEDMVVTRHVIKYSPEAIQGEELRSVCAIAPGVLGITGIETGEIIEGIVNNVRPSLVIAIDALASRSVERVGTTIQIADTGINPGSGLGNKRKGLSRETLGVPVIAIGCPTVVYASTIAQDTVDAVMSALSERFRGHNSVEQTYLRLEENERQNLVRDLLCPHLGSLVVTPKEIDTIIDDMAKIIAGGLNITLQPDVQMEDTYYLS